jgi:biotin carboxylase
LELGFSDGPTHTEVIVSPNGDVEIIDLNPRFVGADVLQSINFAFGVKIEEVLLDFSMGIPVRFTPTESNFSCLQYVLAPQSGTFETVTFPKHPEVRFTTSYKENGECMESVDRQFDYVGCYLTVMPSFQQAIKRSLELRREVRINHICEGAY